MDAICVCKNGIHQLAAELLPSAGVGFDISWNGNPKQGLAVYLTRTDELGRQERWKDLQVFVGDKISLVTREADTVDEPIECLTNEEMVNLARSKPKMKPGNRVGTALREIGVLDCHINNKPLLSFCLTTDNMLSVGFVWLGDRTGTSMLHIGSGVSPTPLIPEIAFGDEVTFLWRSPNKEHRPG